MGTLFLDRIKRQASSFLHQRYKTVRLVLTDVTPGELLAEEATNNDPCSPDAKTMTTIAEASYDIDDYWRIVDVLHRRLDNIDWKQWRQSYKSLVLLDFLLTHGPEDFAEEFQCDTDVIQELGTFKHKDEKGFDWGVNMQKKSERILELLHGGETLRQARLKALRITKEIQGFGNSTVSPSPSSSSSSDISQTSSFGSYSTTSSTWNKTGDQLNKHEQSLHTKEAIENHSQMGIRDGKPTILPNNNNENVEWLHHWDCPPIEEKGSLLDSEDDEEEKPNGLISGICSKLVGLSPSKRNGEKVAFRSFSDVGKVTRKKINRQFSIGY
uniref:Putative epsin-2 n=1 Tax=Davidia involucrata TaxID=16924 RepID=A0A5B6YJ30_DAVIN